MEEIASDVNFYKTSFTPLHSRAKEGDVYSQKIVDYLKQLDNFECPSSYIAFAVKRTNIIDAAVKNLLLDFPDAVIANLGAGFCCRFHRVDNGRCKWYDLDYPLPLKHKSIVFPQTDRLKYIGLDLKTDNPPEDVTHIVAEGFVAQMPEARAKELINKRAIFDVQGPGRTVALGRDQYWKYNPDNWSLKVFNKWRHDDAPRRDSFVLDAQPA